MKLLVGFSELVVNQVFPDGPLNIAVADTAVNLESCSANTKIEIANLDSIESVYECALACIEQGITEIIAFREDYLVFADLLKHTLEQTSFASMAFKDKKWWRSIASENYQSRFDSESGYILKPRYGKGSEDVKKIDTAVEYDSKKYVLEPFAQGSEYSLEIYLKSGKYKYFGITEKYVNSDFKEVAHIHRPSISQELTSFIEEETKLLLDRLDIVEGPLHLEFKIENFGSSSYRLFWIEGHDRPGGDWITELVKISSGFNFYGELFGLKQERLKNCGSSGILFYSGSQVFLIEYMQSHGISSVAEVQGDRVGYFIFKNEEEIKVLKGAIKKYGLDK